VDNQQCCDDEIDLMNYVKVIYKHRVMVIVIAFAGMFLAGIQSLTKPSMFEAQTSVFPIDMEYNLEMIGSIEKPAVTKENLIISILKSRTMADRVIEQLDLKKFWGKELMIDARKELSDASSVAAEKNGIINLSVVSQDPELSAKIANAYIDNLDYFNDELKLGVQRKIVQVIDRAVVPEDRLPRGTVKKVFLAGITSLMFSIFLVFFMDFIRNSDAVKRNRMK